MGGWVGGNNADPTIVKREQSSKRTRLAKGKVGKRPGLVVAPCSPRGRNRWYLLLRVPGCEGKRLQAGATHARALTRKQQPGGGEGAKGTSLRSSDGALARRPCGD